MSLDPNWWGLGGLGVLLIAHLISSTATYKRSREGDAILRELAALHREILEQTDTDDNE